MPKHFSDKPAMVVELKWNKSAERAVEQIKDKQYAETLKEYKGNILLVGINYDKKKKKYQCVIDEI